MQPETPVALSLGLPERLVVIGSPKVQEPEVKIQTVLSVVLAVSISGTGVTREMDQKFISPRRVYARSEMRGRSEQILLTRVGCEARKNPAVGVVFLLDFCRTASSCCGISGGLLSWRDSGQGSRLSKQISQ